MEVLEQAERYDRVAVNERVEPLTVKRVDRDAETLQLEGPQGGDYELGPTEPGVDEWVLRYFIDGNHANTRSIDHLELVEHHSVNIGNIYELSEVEGGCGYLILTDGCKSPLPDRYQDNEWVDTLKLTFDGGGVRTHERRRLVAEIKDRVFDSELSHVDTLHTGLSQAKPRYLDTATDREVYITDPRPRGVDVRPVDREAHGHGFDVVPWDEVLHTNRFELVEPDPA
jgi:hypothetical protein